MRRRPHHPARRVPGRSRLGFGGVGNDVVSLGRLEAAPEACRGGAGFDVLQLRATTQEEFEAQALPFTATNEYGWLF